MLQHTPSSLRRALQHLRRWAPCMGLALAAGSMVACTATPPSSPPEAPTVTAPAAAPQPDTTRSPAPASTAPAAPVAPVAPPLPTLPFDEAVLSAARALLGKAQLPADGKFNVVIDPLIDGMTGAQTVSTQAMGARLAKLIQDSYPRYAVQPFRAATVQQGPLVLVGTFTGVNAERKTEGKREAYRICLALADLKTGKLVGKGLAFAKSEGVNAMPLPYFRDAPVWLDDAATTGYIRTCQDTQAGDPINPAYLDRIVTATTVAEAIDAYATGKYADALKLYETAQASPGGNQLRVHTGLYLTNLKLRRMDAARKAFGDAVDQGLDSKRLGLKFLFRPGTAAPWADAAAGPQPYALWVNEIGARAAKRSTCLEFAGHTSASGAEPLNQRLSLQRAAAIQRSVEAASPQLRKRITARGFGSQQTLVGTGRDDLTDALDRRVELLVKDCA